MTPFHPPPPSYFVSLTEPQCGAIRRAIRGVIKDPAYADVHDDLVSALGAISAATPDTHKESP